MVPVGAALPEKRRVLSARAACPGGHVERGAPFSSVQELVLLSGNSPSRIRGLDSGDIGE